MSPEGTIVPGELSLAFRWPSDLILNIVDMLNNSIDNTLSPLVIQAQPDLDKMQKIKLFENLKSPLKFKSYMIG